VRDVNNGNGIIEKGALTVEEKNKTGGIHEAESSFFERT